MNHQSRRRIHNLKYFTWIEQQKKTVEELNAQWYDYRSYRPEHWNKAPEYDQLIVSFNERVRAIER